MELLHQLLQLDHAAIEQSAQLRWSPATAFFALASAWWIKGPLFVVAAFARDLKDRATVPLTALAVGAALLAGDLLSGAIKHAVDRPRPPRADPGFDAAVAVPSSPSFPSGHATTTFACAVAIALLIPRLRWPALAVAATVGLSRVYLGVHYALDVVAGAALGTLIGAAIALLVRRVLAARRAAAAPA
ncbi:MAG TPA: phosphatase PAP2 family protein [Solirubrobacteraceae bacterium]|jgi:undecaprenyl-diphosphatase|nr:phosphatase PAP2 family protein [Solirubrobacteraceae bacterium]